MKNILLITLASTFLFWACNSGSEKTTATTQSADADSIGISDSLKEVDNGFSQAISPPIKGTKQSTVTQIANTAKGDTLVFNSGSVVIIPPSSIIDAQGKPFTGACAIRLTEYMDAASIILSGIPMLYSENGKVLPFTSAGMFSITADAPGQTLSIAPGQTIDVRQATSVKKNTFDCFYFNEQKNQWVKTGSSTPQKNTLTQTVAMPLPETPVKPVRKSDKAFTFDMDINTQDFPEFKRMKGISWQSAKEKGFPDAEKDQDKIFNTMWYDVKLQPYKRDQSKYILQLSNDRETYRTVVVPALDEQNYDAAMKTFDNQMKQYEADKIKALAFRKTVQAGADVVRSMKLSSFGLYNHDILNSMDEPVTCQVSFVQPNGKPVATAKAWLISKTSMTIITYGPESYDTFDKFMYSSKDTYGILTMDSLSALGYVSSSVFSAATARRGNAIFKITPVKGAVTSPESLKKIIQQM